jgi:two-component system, cell cycle response regulator
MAGKVGDDTTNVLVDDDDQTAGERAPYFIVVAGIDLGRLYRVEAAETIIGRDDSAGIQVHDAGVSRAHAKIVRAADGGVCVVDLGSRNGTLVGTERVERRVLADGDKVKIGRTILMFSMQDGVEASFYNEQYERATRDPLAHCHSRKYLVERLPSDVAFVGRHGMALTLVMIDIDHFKQVNDTHGHAAGDEVLRTTARVIQDSIRSDDVLTRFGGDEFVVVMRNTLTVAARIAAERIARRVADNVVTFEGKPISVTLSVGITTCTKDKLVTPDELLRNADRLLYRAKEAGRNRIEVDAEEA